MRLHQESPSGLVCALVMQGLGYPSENNFLWHLCAPRNNRVYPHRLLLLDSLRSLDCSAVAFVTLPALITYTIQPS